MVTLIMANISCKPPLKMTLNAYGDDSAGMVPYLNGKTIHRGISEKQNSVYKRNV